MLPRTLLAPRALQHKSPGAARLSAPALDPGPAGAQARESQKLPPLGPGTFGFQQRMHLAGSSNCALIFVGLVVLLDIPDLIAVVAHEAVRLAHALGRGITLPVDAFQARTVAQMES